MATAHQSPTYVVVEESGPDHAKEFAVEVLVAGGVRGRGARPSKQQSKPPPKRRWMRSAHRQTAGRAADGRSRDREQD